MAFVSGGEEGGDAREDGAGVPGAGDEDEGWLSHCAEDCWEMRMFGEGVRFWGEGGGGLGREDSDVRLLLLLCEFRRSEIYLILF